MEKLNLENNSLELNSIQKEWKIGIVKFELFANFDDDNNAYGESLIKRGLYPFNSNIEVKKELDNVVSFEVNLKKVNIMTVVITVKFIELIFYQEYF